MGEGLGRALRRPWQLARAQRLALDAFAQRYAEAHGLSYAATGATPGGSAFLGSVVQERSHGFMRGAIAGGADGVLFYVEREVTVSRRRTIYQGWTVARFGIAEVRALAAGLACVPRLTPVWGGRVALPSPLPKDLDPVETGDADFDARHEVAIASPADRDAVRVLFTHSFAAWLDDGPWGRHGEASTRFELRRDVLCVYARDKQRTATTLDAFCARAAHIAEHVRATATPPP